MTNVTIVDIKSNDGEFINGTAEFKGKSYQWTAWLLKAFDPPVQHVSLFSARTGRKVSSTAMSELRTEIANAAWPNT